MQHLDELASALLTQLASPTRWKSRLKNTHQEPTGQQSTICLCQALTSRDHTENEHVDPQKVVWSNARQRHDHVTWDFDQHEGDIENPQAGCIAIQWHVQALLKTFNPRIGNCT
jgi:hypothetical protein